ncbi:MAG: MCP four helix bundle domain-containing protein [Blastocatellia bacterium]|nr:MCP four helix bundle domain-containing protein [Blastocatellia bacterium]MBL8194158.1 MCP four helix bundle domain-containing protein [Blastocatellia bacterium]MBN8725693.1 MCP four helix bundle domain-containing protein [Acidobacteriota bacterium]
MFEKMTIAKRLILAFSVILILFCCVGGISFWCLYKLYKEVELLQTNAKISTYAMQVRSDYANMRRFEKGIFINVSSIEKQDPYLTIWNNTHKDLISTIVELNKYISSEEDKKIVTSMQQILTNYEYGFDETVDQLRKGKYQTAEQANDAMDKYRWAANGLESTGKQLAVKTGQRSTLSLQSLTNQLKYAVWITSVTLLGIVFFIGVFGVLFMQSITKPLLQAVEVAQKVALGDITQNIKTTNNSSEIGQLLLSMKNMVESLKENAIIAEQIALGNLNVKVKERSELDTFRKSFRKMVKDLQNAVISISKAADQVFVESSDLASASEHSSKVNRDISISVDTTSTAICQISVNTQNIAKKTEEQLSFANQISKSNVAMVSSINNITQACKEMLNISAQSKKDVLSSVETIDKNIKGIDKINESLSHLTQTVFNLQNKTNNISKMVDVIANVADQTNLLALNAAIEAARAGEYGLGFGVIAEEVRRLSDQCRNSTQEITDLIRDTKKEVNKAVKDLEKSSQIVNESTLSCNSARLELKCIEKSVIEVHKFTIVVDEANNKQTEIWNTIAEIFSKLNSLTEQINAATFEQAIGVREIAESVEKIAIVLNENTILSSRLAYSGKKMEEQSQILQKFLGHFYFNTAKLVEENY